jgi:excisionase family DNA binding protein
MSVLADFITDVEIAAELKVRRRTVNEYCRQPDGLPYVKVGGRRLFRRSDVDAWLERKTVRPCPTRRSAR